MFGDDMKLNRHNNMFNPTLECLIPLEDIVSWFDAVPEFYKSVRPLLLPTILFWILIIHHYTHPYLTRAQVVRLPPEKYTPLLEEGMQCTRCNAGFATMPALKAYLEAEFKKMLRMERACRAPEGGWGAHCGPHRGRGGAELRQRPMRRMGRMRR